MCQPRGAARLRDTSVPQDASYAHRLTVFSPLVMLLSWNNLEGERPEPLLHSQVCSKTTEKEAEGSGFSSALAQVAAVAPRPALTARASRHLVTSAEAGVCSSSPGSSLLSPHSSCDCLYLRRSPRLMLTAPPAERIRFVSLSSSNTECPVGQSP